MTCHLFALCFYANRPLRLARFWAGVLGWEMADDPQDGIALLPSDDTGFRIRFLPTLEQKTGQNQMHFDLTSTSPEDQQQTVARALGLGARHIDIGQRPEEGPFVQRTRRSWSQLQQDIARGAWICCNRLDHERVDRSR